MSNLNPAASHSPGDCFQSPQRTAGNLGAGSSESHEGDRETHKSGSITRLCKEKPASALLLPGVLAEVTGLGGLGKKERRRSPQGRLAKDSLLSLFCALLLAWPCPTELAILSGGGGGSAEGWLPGGGEVEAGRYLPDPSRRETKVCWGTGKEPGRWEEPGGVWGGGACRGPHLRGPVEPALKGRRPPSL